MERTYICTEAEFKSQVAHVLCYKLHIAGLQQTTSDSVFTTFLKNHDLITKIWQEYEKELKCSIERDIVDKALELHFKLLK